LHGRLAFDPELLHGLVPLHRSHLDVAAGGAFFSLSVADAKTLIEKMVSNQGWSDD
jgi:hypothetical protein